MAEDTDHPPGPAADRHILFAEDEGALHSRTASVTSSRSNERSEAEEPEFGGSTARLILEEPDNPSLFMSFDDDLEGNTADGSPTSALLGIGPNVSIPGGAAPLPFYAIQLFLVSATLLLGADRLQDAIHGEGKGFNKVSLTIVWALLSALLSSLASQVWILSARYLRRWRFVVSGVVAVTRIRLLRACYGLQSRGSGCLCSSGRTRPAF
jgi:hypothetical protein